MGSCFKFSRKKNSYYFNEPYTPDESNHHKDNRAAYLKAWTSYEKGFQGKKTSADAIIEEQEPKIRTHDREEQLKRFLHASDPDYDNKTDDEKAGSLKQSDCYGSIENTQTSANAYHQVAEDDIEYKPVTMENSISRPTEEDVKIPEHEHADSDDDKTDPPSRSVVEPTDVTDVRHNDEDEKSAQQANRESVISYNSEYDYQGVGTETVQRAGLY